MDYKSLVNPRIFEVPDYDQGHVTYCWENPDVRRLMSNESSYSPIPAVQEAIRQAAGLANYYGEDPAYAESVRSKLAAYTGVKTENVTLSNGSIEVLDLVFQIFLTEPGVDQCILLQPDYSAYVPRLTFFGWDIIYASHEDDGAKTADNILAKITPKTKFVLFSRPNNPLGSMLPEEDIIRLLESGIVVIVDEAYVETADEGSSISDWVNDWDNLLVLRTFSKGFSLAGIRLGYILAPPEIVRYINRARHIFNVNLIALLAAEAALDHIDELKAIFREVASTRDWMIERLEQVPGLKPLPSQGNFVMINTAGTGLPASAFVTQMLEKGFMVRDFSKKAGLPPNEFFRITVGLREDMEVLLAEIEQFVQHASPAAPVA